MSNPKKPKRFVLLDRDGTINVERHYLSDPDQLDLLPNAMEGLKELSQLGFGLIVITNQSAIGRGHFDRGRLRQIHRRLEQLLASGGVRLDGIYFCPHLPEDECLCRKPQPGLVEQAAKDHGFVLKDCFVIGDKDVDIQLGHKIGATTILVRTGYGYKVEVKELVKPHHITDDLLSAAEIIKHSI